MTRKSKPKTEAELKERQLPGDYVYVDGNTYDVDDIRKLNELRLEQARQLIAKDQELANVRAELDRERSRVTALTSARESEIRGLNAKALKLDGKILVQDHEIAQLKSALEKSKELTRAVETNAFLEGQNFVLAMIQFGQASVAVAKMDPALRAGGLTVTEDAKPAAPPPNAPKTSWQRANDIAGAWNVGIHPNNLPIFMARLNKEIEELDTKIMGEVERAAKTMAAQRDREVPIAAPAGAPFEP